jgi:phosphohistidine phosphatase
VKEETVQLYLVQHGRAHPKEVDVDRSLTERGREEVERVAALASQMALIVHQIRHSGKTRAAQTAEILARALVPSDGIMAVPGLAPNDDVYPIALELAAETEPAMLVGHMPFMARLAALLLSDEAERPIIKFRYAAIVCLIRDGDQWQIAWILTPEMASAGKAAGYADEGAYESLTRKGRSGEPQQREQRAVESILDDERLTADLDDAAAQALLDWGMASARRIARTTSAADSATADEAMYQRLRATRKLMRWVNQWVASSQSATSVQEADALSEILDRASCVYGVHDIPLDQAQQDHFHRLEAECVDEPARLIIRLREFVESALDVRSF